MASPKSAYGDGSTDGRSEGTFGKVCRACTDFKTWMNQKDKSSQRAKPAPDAKQHGDVKTPSNTAGDLKNPTEERTDCPLDRDMLGRNTWSFLHTVAAYYPDKPTQSQQKDMDQFLELFAKFYPCDECAKDLRDKLKKFPPSTNNQEDLSQWLCRIHNQVNARLGKEEFDCRIVNRRWRDGWEDGSC